MPAQFYLIRHGQTDWSREKRYCGSRTDMALNETGRAQAQRLSNKLSGKIFTGVYTSPMKRTREFCEIALGVAAGRMEPGLCELDFGDFSGHTHDELMACYPEQYGNWLKNPFTAGIPGGENLKDFEIRVSRAWKDILEQSHGTVAVVAHGGPLRLILAEVLGLDKNDIWSIRQDEACLNIVEAEGGKTRVTLLNDISHL